VKSEEEHLRLNRAKWDRWADSLDEKGWRSRFLRKAQLRVISALDIRPNVKFLDIGCGTGWAMGQVASLVNDDGQFYGVDLSPSMIQRAETTFAGRRNFHFLEGTAESIPLHDNFFDVIICTNSFHHYLHPDTALLEMRRLLKNGGKVYILDPTADTWTVKLTDALGRLLEPEHVKLYSTVEFKRMFERAGLKYSSPETTHAHDRIHVGEK
jgi:ubiquinone/menaquinone biosynthesis C-methylase UbiE